MYMLAQFGPIMKFDPNRLIRPNIIGPLVTVLTEFHRIYLLCTYVDQL